MSRAWKSVGGVIVAIGLWLGGGANPSRAADDVGGPPARSGQQGLFSLPGRMPKIPNPVSLFDYDVKLDQEKFYLCIPPNYRGREPFGLLAMVNAGDQMDLPPDWEPLLAKYKLIYLAPQGVGNAHATSRRGGLTVAAIYKMMELYEIDPQRVYVTGLSGGSKVACNIGFYHPDLVHGVVLMCGVMFPAPFTLNTFECDASLIEKTKASVGFALVTGSKDFNRPGILKTFNEGYTPGGYRVKLFDTPGMGHELARTKTLEAALKWLNTETR